MQIFTLAKICFRGGNLFFFFFFEKQLKIEKKSKKLNKLPLLKCILALPTLGQICIIFVLQPSEIPKFQIKHPVHFLDEKSNMIRII